jgi:nucleoside 2-deoxyribosyltransferase
LEFPFSIFLRASFSFGDESFGSDDFIGIGIQADLSYRQSDVQNSVDAKVDLSDTPKAEAGVKIGQMNEGLIRSCDLVIANMTPFRGPSTDVGTGYEMGFARALGLPVFAYANVTNLFSPRTVEWLGKSGSTGTDGRFYDDNGMAVEDWDLFDNLMLDSCIISSGGNLVTNQVLTEATFTDLHAFELCLQKARTKFWPSKLNR